MNVGYHRYSIDNLVRKIIMLNPDILGISAVAFTSYLFVKMFSRMLKKNASNIVQVLGGNMAASTEIILKRTGVYL